MTTQTDRMREALNAADVVQTLIDQKALGAPAHQILVNAVRTLTQPEQPAPQGWKLVPVEPTGAMCLSTIGILHSGEQARLAYKAMLAASPTPPQAEQANEADELLRNLGLDPERYRTEAGFINHLKVKAAIKYPDQYPQAEQAEAAKPATLSEFIRSDDSTRDAIVARVVDAAVEMQREVLAKPETERAELSAEAFADLIPLGAVVMADANGPRAVMMTYPQLRKFADALLSADSKDAGEPVAGYVDAHELKMLQKGALEPTISRDPVSEHDVPLYTRPQAAELAALKADMAKYVHIASEQATEIEALRGLLNEAPKFFSYYEFNGEKLEWLQKSDAMQTKEAS